MAVSCGSNLRNSEKNFAIKIDFTSLHSFFDKPLNLEVDLETHPIETDLFKQGHLFLQKATAKWQLSSIVIIFINHHLQISSPR